MELKIGSEIRSENCHYVINRQLSPAVYLVRAVLVGDLGNLDSEETFLLVINGGLINALLNNPEIKGSAKDFVVERLTASDEKALVIQDSPDMRHLLSSIKVPAPDKTVEAENIPVGNRYRGETRNGRPHGKGILEYCDGRVYTGCFENGMRHGYGKLVLPDGEYFEGIFQNDSITEDGSYYDKNGKLRNPDKSRHGSVWTLIWEKSWRLIASVGCFILMAIAADWLIGFFTSGSGHTIRITALIAPLVFFGLGMKYLVEFFIHLFSKE